MGFLLAAVSALHISVLVLLFAATLDKVWWALPDGQSVSLWYHCVALRHNALRCRELRHDPRLQAVQALAVSGLFLSALSFVLFLLFLHVGPRGRLLLPPAGTQLAAGVAALAAFLLFVLWGPGSAPPPHDGTPGGAVGRSAVMAAVGGALALGSGGWYLRLRVTE